MAASRAATTVAVDGVGSDVPVAAAAIDVEAVADSSRSSDARPGRRGRRRAIVRGLETSRWSPLAVIVVFVAGVEIASRTGAINPVLFPAPSVVAARLQHNLGDVVFWRSAWATLSSWVIAFVIAFALALLLGILIGANRWIRGLLGPITEFLRPVPSTAMVPLALLAIGTNSRATIFLAAWGGLWQTLPMVIKAVGQVDPVARDTAVAFRFSRRQRLWWLTLPSMEPFLLTAVRIGVTVTLTLTISMEMLSGVVGLGRQIGFSRAAENRPGMYAYIIVVGLIGLAVNLVVSRWVDRRMQLIGRQR